MSKSAFCKNCIHWEQITPKAIECFGVCTDTGVAMKVALNGKTNLAEDGTFWTEAYFGCIYWRENDGSIVDFEDIIDEDGKPIEDE